MGAETLLFQRPIPSDFFILYIPNYENYLHVIPHKTLCMDILISC